MSISSRVRAKNFILLGAPGAGKSTFANLFQRHVPVSAGWMIRQKARDTTHPLFKEINYQLKTNAKVDESIATFLVLERLKELNSQKRLWLLDGFPRNLHQARTLKDFMPLRATVVHLDVDQKTSTQRLLNRCLYPFCLENYNLLTRKFNFCDRCNTELSKRDDDDSIEKIRQRWEIYKQHDLAGVKEYFRKNNMSVITIDVNHSFF
ncbi:MAG: adenylate kinase [Candidatus Anoxychlamydiales bacterium]|nr:adenylate kinase [Candidatus Anoxychlamydiales bacterium]